MWITLSKTLPYLVYPLTIALLLILVALVLPRRRVWLGRFFLFMAFLVLAASSFPPVARIVYGSLEARYPPVEISKLANADVIVLLGGGLRLPLPPRQDFELTDSSNRARYAAKLFRAGKANRVLVSGGNLLEQGRGVQPEAHYVRMFLGELGVPSEAILIEDRSRSTWENALETKRILERQGLKRVLLVTSAAHMPRALGSFRAAGIDATPAPTDYRVDEHEEPALLKFLPSADALDKTTEGLREYLGHAVYRLRGWM
jgi:uncharacterized SAM-binding protein YcdF (DUF218 family)